MEWWCWIHIQGNDRNPLPCTRILYPGLFDSLLNISRIEFNDKKATITGDHHIHYNFLYHNLLLDDSQLSSDFGVIKSLLWDLVVTPFMNFLFMQTTISVTRKMGNISKTETKRQFNVDISIYPSNICLCFYSLIILQSLFWRELLNFADTKVWSTSNE